jgi:hypothetical protein
MAALRCRPASETAAALIDLARTCAGGPLADHATALVIDVRR